MNDQSSPKKRLRIGHLSERGGINAVRSLLERQGLVVDEVDGRSDYGRDLNVDLTHDAEITGGIIGIQVKGGRSFFRGGQWVIPATKTDWDYWRASTVPIIGMVHDPDTGVIRWINLTEAARSRVLTQPSSYDVQEQDDNLNQIAVVEVLNDKTFDSFIDRTEAYLSATGESAYLLLLNKNDEIRRRGVFNCWTLGRRDPRPLVLLRRIVPSMSNRSLGDAITVLAHVTPHPDIFWNEKNWISPLVEEEVRASLRWSPDELVELVHAVEMLDDEDAVWERGGLGQSLWSIMVVDPDLSAKLPKAIRAAVEAERIQAAVRLVVCLQYLAADPVSEVDALMRTYPSLAEDQMAKWVVEDLHEHGRLSVY